MGHGQFFMKALQYGGFRDYLAVDLSPTSVDQCKKYMAYCGMDEEKYRILQKIFLNFHKNGNMIILSWERYLSTWSSL